MSYVGNGFNVVIDRRLVDDTNWVRAEIHEATLDFLKSATKERDVVKEKLNKIKKTEALLQRRLVLSQLKRKVR